MAPLKVNVYWNRRFSAKRRDTCVDLLRLSQHTLDDVYRNHMFSWKMCGRRSEDVLEDVIKTSVFLEDAELYKRKELLLYIFT